MSILRATTLQHGSSAVQNIVLDNQGRASFGPDGPQAVSTLYVNAQTSRVGVNTESPSVALDVTGAINSTGNVTAGGTLTVTGITTLTNDLIVDTDTLFVDVSTNRVGIGTTTPDQLLHLKSTSSFIAISDSADAGESGILFRRTDNNQNRGYVIYDFTNDALKFRASTNGSGEEMRIDSAGNVGIGSTDPADKLEVAGDIRLKPASGSNTLINFEYNNGIFAQIRGNGRNGSPLYGDLEFWTKGSTDSNPEERMVVTADGLVGIGTTSPSSIFHLQSSNPVLTMRDSDTSGDNISSYILFEDSSGTDKAYIGRAGSSDLRIFGNGDTVFATGGIATSDEVARIDSTGVLQTTNGVQLNKYGGITNNIKMVLVTGDGGTNTVQVYWNLSVGATKAGGCLGSYKNGTYSSPTTTISSSSTHAIYGFIDT